MDSNGQVTRQYTTITPQRARQLLAKNWGGQRKVRDYWVDILGREMVAGKFLEETLRITQIADLKSIPAEYADSNGELMCDGQHRCLASVKYGIAFPAIIITHKVKDWISFLDLNERLDVGLDRAEPDMNNYWLEKVGREGVWPKAAISSIKAALIWKMGIQPRQLAKRERLEILNHNMPLIKEVMGILSRLPKFGHITRKPVMAAMLDTITKNKAASRDFWYKVGSLDNVSSNTPEWQLGHALPSIQSQRRRDIQAIYIRVIRAWNKAHPESRIVIKFATADSSKQNNLLPAMFESVA